MPWVSGELYGCPKCGEAKPWSEFLVDSRRLKPSGKCAPCRSEYNRGAERVWKSNHPVNPRAAKRRAMLKLRSRRKFNERNGVKRRLSKETPSGIWCGWCGLRHHPSLFDPKKFDKQRNKYYWPAYCKKGEKENRRANENINRKCADGKRAVTNLEISRSATVLPWD